MKAELAVPESDVLIAATIFLIKRDVIPYRFSVATGSGLRSAEAISRLREASAAIGHEPEFVGNGADILGVSELEWWAIECKGAGSGKPQTQRNNFDRALASTVSYFEETPPNVPKPFENATVCLGLALPATPAYLRELRHRVRSPLRRCLNLWVLLYNLESETIRAVAPKDSEAFRA